MTVQHMSKIIIDNRIDLVNNLKQDVKKTLQLAVWLQNNKGKAKEPKFINFQNRVRSNETGDGDVTAWFIEALNHANSSYTPEHWSIHYRLESDKSPERKHLPIKPDPEVKHPSKVYRHLTQVVFDLRGAVNRLNSLRLDYVQQVRSLRFFKTLLNIEHGLECQGGTCASPKALNARHLTILGNCGHVVCHPCLQAAIDCPAAACKATIQVHQLVHVKDLMQNSGETNKLQYGTKLDQVIHLVESIDEKDKVLVFVQSKHLFKQVENALKSHRIEYADLSKGAGAAKKLLDFQKGNVSRGSSKAARVCLLNIGDSSAAGR